jgi:hypothetical protein
MQDAAHLLEESLAGQSGQAWLGALEELADEVGYFQPLSAKHNAAFFMVAKRCSSVLKPCNPSRTSTARLTQLVLKWCEKKVGPS